MALRGLLSRLGGATRGDRLLWGCISLLVLYCCINQFGEARRVVSGTTDFGTFYDAGAALVRGDDPYRATGEGYFYPPTFAFYFRFLTWLPKVAASFLWFGIKLILAVWSLVVVDTLLEGRLFSNSRRRWFIAGTVFVAARFLVSDLQFGNVNTVILWLGLMAVALDFKGCALLAGCALAAAVSIKIVPAVFLIYFVVRGRGRLVGWTFLWLVAFNLLPFAFAPHLMAESWTSYLAAGVESKLGSSLAQPDNQSLWGFLNRSLGLSLPRIRLVWVVCSAFFASIAALLSFRVRREASGRHVGAAALFFLLGLLVSPGSWVVHYSAVLLPMAYLLREAMRRRPPAWSLWAIFAALNAAFTGSGLARLAVRLSIEQSWFVGGTCLLFFTIGYLIMRGAGGARGELAGS
jgi:alpha-1,2-mannosyltransferase